ncbi:ATP-binding protein [Vampirovibrio sp.]|uniref:sensor histidine kinase n=1 Tax=Vampirovibrio sp. TaxID=2717857 RepID=UPI00359418D0
MSDPAITPHTAKKADPSEMEAQARVQTPQKEPRKGTKAEALTISPAVAPEADPAQPDKPLTLRGHVLEEAKTAIEASELARSQAELARSQAELARDKAEDARFSAESARNKVEEARLEAKVTNAQAEHTDNTQAEDIVRADDIKRKTEAAKAQAESALKNSLIAIAESDQARMAAEKARDKALSTALQLEDYATSLEIINQDLEAFASIASHDLQAPLRRIGIFSEMIEADSQNTLSDSSKDRLQRIRKSAQTMRELTQNLLALARVSNPGLFKPLDLSALLKDVLLKLDQQIAEKKAVLKIGAFTPVMGDESQLKQLFQNLIENALKYQAPQAIPVVEISSTQQKQTCQITVSDNGIGFDQQHAEHIFDAFYRIHGIEDYSGSGMGLAICKRIAKRHKGSITARSTPGEGSVFTITLPSQSIP